MNRIERLLYRLRHMRTKSVCHEAADEIERLLELLEKCKQCMLILDDADCIGSSLDVKFWGLFDEVINEIGDE